MATQGGPRVYAIFKVKDPQRTRLIVLDTQDLSLGRSNENDLAIDEPEMSRKHVVFTRTATGCRLSDMGTSNGTHVNGASVDHADLSHGDVIRIGEVEITYARTSKSPASLGPSVEYASQLKSFGSPMAGQASDGESTILGLMEPAGDPGDEFEVQAAGDFDLELNAERPPGSRRRARNLDEEIADLGPDPVEDFASAAASPAAPVAPAGRKAEPDPVWELDDAEIVADAPAPVEAAAAPAKPAGRLHLTLEIEGAEGELRGLLEGLAGKLIEVPRLRVRVKSDDLG